MYDIKLRVTIQRALKVNFVSMFTHDGPTATGEGGGVFS